MANHSKDSSCVVLELVCVVSVLAALALAYPAVADDLIFRGDFESGDLCDWSEVVPPPGNCPISIDLPNGAAMDLVYIPAGVFFMGSSEDERGRSSNEDLHEVSLTQGYFMGATEVTQGQWQAVTGSPMSYSCGITFGIGADYPVYCVSWDDIAGPGGFFELLNAHLTSTGQPGAGMFRLPTEAEWERGARGGTQTEFSFAASPDWDLECGPFQEADLHMWWCGNDNTQSEPVGSKLSNPYDVHDMHGSLWEWVQDWYVFHIGYDPVIDPTGPASGTYRVVRGGFWAENAEDCRSASRHFNNPSGSSAAYGFRVVRSE